MNVGKKIGQVKGNMTYEEFAQDICEKTGYPIHWTTLQKYITGHRKPSLKILEVLAEYAKVPVTFFVDDNKELQEKIVRLEKLKSLKKDYAELSKIKDVPILIKRLYPYPQRPRKPRQCRFNCRQWHTLFNPPNVSFWRLPSHSDAHGLAG